MRISVSTRHGHLSPETQEKIGHKIEKLGRFHNKISAADVTIDLKDEREPHVEICLVVDGASNFVSQTRGSSLLGAVDGAVNKLEEQLRRHKEKLIDHHRDSARRSQQMQAPADDELDDDLVGEDF